MAGENSIPDVPYIMPGEAMLSVTSDNVMAEKVKAYVGAVDLFYGYMDPEFARRVKKHGLNQKEVKTLGKKVGEVGLHISLFGSTEVVKKYSTHRLLSQGGGDPIPVVDSFIETIIAMRRDLLGDGAGDISTDEILSTFLVLEEMADEQNSVT